MESVPFKNICFITRKRKMLKKLIHHWILQKKMPIAIHFNFSDKFKYNWDEGSASKVIIFNFTLYLKNQPLVISFISQKNSKL